MAGRPRLPRQTKIIQGTFHKYRNPGSEAEFPGVFRAPSPPRSLNQYGKKLWKQLAPELAASGVLTVADLPAFEMLCGHYGRAKELEAWVNENLLAKIAAERGTAPEVGQMNTEFSMTVKLMQDFGLTPASRNRFGVNKKTADDPDTEKMKRLLGA